MTLVELIKQYAIIGKILAEPWEIVLGDREIYRMRLAMPLPCPTNNFISLRDLQQIQLAICLSQLRGGVEPSWSWVCFAAPAEAGWPNAHPGDSYPPLGPFHTIGPFIKCCLQNVALILQAADDPAQAVKAAGFDDIESCIEWALELPDADCDFKNALCMTIVDGQLAVSGNSHPNESQIVAFAHSLQYMNMDNLN